MSLHEEQNLIYSVCRLKSTNTLKRGRINRPFPISNLYSSSLRKWLHSWHTDFPMTTFLPELPARNAVCHEFRYRLRFLIIQVILCQKKCTLHASVVFLLCCSVLLEIDVVWMRAVWRVVRTVLCFYWPEPLQKKKSPLYSATGHQKFIIYNEFKKYTCVYCAPIFV